MPQSSNKPTFLLLQARLPAIDPGRFLGRFVTHPKRPLDNYVPSDPAKLIGGQVVELVERKSTEAIGEIANAEARLAAQSLIELGASKDGGQITKIVAPFVKTYRLENHYKAFDALESDLQIREELDGPKGLFTRSRGKLYMIIGYKTCGPKTSFERLTDKGHDFTALVTVPLSQALNALPFSIADPEAKLQAGKRNVTFTRFTTESESIFAVEYKIVSRVNAFGLYSPKAETVIAHNPMTHDMKHAMYGGERKEDVLEGHFEEDDEGKGGPQARPEGVQDIRLKLMEEGDEETRLLIEDDGVLIE